jgi:hypothetical protein
MRWLEKLVVFGTWILLAEVSIVRYMLGGRQTRKEKGVTSESEPIPRRPTSITVICIIGFIGALIAVPLMCSPMAEQIGSWYPLYLALSSVIGVVCMAGLWMMRKWAAYTYTGFVVLNQVVLLAKGAWNIMALIIPAIAIVFVVRNASKMS